MPRKTKKGKERPQKKSRKERLLEKILKTITPIKPSSDGNGNYLHYCTYYQHPGVIGADLVKERGCIEKKCHHYRKYREN